jgi:hypothetical protein
MSSAGFGTCSGLTCGRIIIYRTGQRRRGAEFIDVAAGHGLALAGT